MPPRVRKLALTAHVACSVGWLGTVAAFLALAVAGLAGGDAERVRAAYVAMEMTAWYAIVPLSVASLATGVAQGLGTEWGVLRHYWVVVKLGINLLSTLLLLMHVQPIERVAEAAMAGELSGDDLRPVRIQLVADAALALAALVVATALSVYKPRGLTPLGRRVRRGRGA